MATARVGYRSGGVDKFRKTGELSESDVFEPLAEDPSTDGNTDAGGTLANLAKLIAQWDEVDKWAATILQGPAPGRVMPIAGDGSVIGRGSSADLQVDDPKMSREHARLEPNDEGIRVIDLGSRNGTLVQGMAVDGQTEVEDGALIQCGQTLMRLQLRNSAEVEAARRLYESSVRDPLTSLYNRRHLDEHLGSELAYAQRHASSLSVLMLDLDHFKEVNDAHGHAAGDEVLRRAAALLTDSLRREDLAARVGGEELVVVIRGVGADGAEVMAERLRADLEALEVPWEDEVLRVTASIGVATVDPEHPADTAKELLAAADRCLYRAKEAGRNCVATDRE